MRICLFGASSDDLAQEYYQKARELGRLIAAGGHALVFGGGAHGVMGAAAEGAAAEGGEIIGVAPEFFAKGGILSPLCTELVFTPSIRERKAEMEERAEAFIVAPGGIGTFEEFFEVLTLKQLGRHSKPMVLLNTLSYFDALVAALSHSAAEGFMGKGGLELFGICAEPEEALSYVLTAKRVTGTGYKLEDYCK